MRLIIAVVLIFLLTSLCPAIENSQIIIPGNGSTGPYSLNHLHIITGSESVSLNGRILRSGEDYFLDYNEGIFNLTKPASFNDTLIVEFQVSPLELKRSYVHKLPVAYVKSDTATFTPKAGKPKVFGSDLDIVGSKGFAVNIGDIGEPSLTQSLDLNITGQLTRDVFIRGSVTDRNFGSSSSGGTRSLDELDKIFLSVESKHFRGDFGDLELTGVPGSLLDFQRKLTGLNLHANAESFSGQSALAFSPGEQIEIFFYGSDGKQGPYILDPDAVSTSVSAEVFLPGTEEVYLDGEKLSRGVENDYTIDYYERYIQFMPKNVITSNSRITVKIQLAPEGYRRSFYHLSSFYEGAFELGAQYIGEKDDNKNPRNFEMGETERNALANAGADQDSAYVSGAKYVGGGEGDYIALIDTSGNTYYDYVGDSAGDYIVSFSRLGAGQGAYEYGGTGKYLYVGPGNGSYSPVIYYPLPESRDHGSIVFRRPGDLYLSSELAVSRYDINSLSSKDETQTGIGFLGNFGWKNRKLEFWGKDFTAELFKAKIRSLDSEFSVPGIIDNPDFFRQYNIQSSAISASQRLFELESNLLSSSNEKINAGGGYLESDLYKARRGFGKFNILTFDKLMLSSSAELSRSENKSSGRISNWNKYETGVKTVRGWFQPGAFYRHELYDGLLTTLDGYKANEYEALTTIMPLTRVTLSSKFVYRNQQAYDNDENWRDQFDRYKLQQGISYGGAASKFNGELNYSRILQRQHTPIEQRLLRNMGDLKLNYNTSDIGVTFYENINGTGQILRAREYVFVGEGKGDYRQDGDDYVPEIGGDYIEVIRQLGETDQIGGYEISGGLRVRINTRALTNDKLLSRFEIDGDFTHSLNLNSDSPLNIKYLLPFEDFNDDEMTYKTYNYNQRLTYRINKAGDYARHVFKKSRSDGSYYQFENQSNRESSHSGELKLFSRNVIGVLVAGEFADQEKWLYSGNVDLEKLKAKVVPEYRPIKALRLEMPLTYANENEKIKDLDIDSYGIGIKAIANIQNYGRFEFDGNYTRVETANNDTFIPYVIAEGKKQGDNFSALVTARFKINSYSRVEFRYTYKELGDGYDNSTLRLEARAEF